MESSSNKNIAFVPLSPRQYIQTGKISGDGEIPQAFDTPPQLFWVRSEVGFSKMGFEKKGAAPLPGDPNFTNQDVLYLTMGVQGTTGYSLHLDSISQTEKEIRFFITTSSPKLNEAVGEALTHPTIAVIVSKLLKDARLFMIFDKKPTEFQQRILE